MLSRRVLPRTLVPHFRVIGLYVYSRTVTHGTLRQVGSSRIAAETVTTRVACFMRQRKYPSGSIVLIAAAGSSMRLQLAILQSITQADVAEFASASAGAQQNNTSITSEPLKCFRKSKKTPIINARWSVMLTMKVLESQARCLHLVWDALAEQHSASLVGVIDDPESQLRTIGLYVRCQRASCFHKLLLARARQWVRLIREVAPCIAAESRLSWIPGSVDA